VNAQETGTGPATKVELGAITAEDPVTAEAVTGDPGDDDLVALVQAANVHHPVSGDKDLTSLATVASSAAVVGPAPESRHHFVAIDRWRTSSLNRDVIALQVWEWKSGPR
jgi:hypothetical protein